MPNGDNDGIALFWALKRLVDSEEVSDRLLFDVLRDFAAQRDGKLKAMAEGILCLVWPEISLVMMDRTRFDALNGALNYREAARYYFAGWAARLERGDRLVVGGWVPDALCDVFQQTIVSE
jgi:hypothetical protein